MLIISMFISAMMQGVIYAPMAMGVFIAFRVLNTPDLTIDGSLVFGMSVCAVVTIAGFPIVGIFAGMGAGAIAGAITGILQTKMNINPILSGILTMTALYTVNYAVLGGQSNRYLQAESGTSITIFKQFSNMIQAIFGEGALSDANTLVLTLTSVIVIIVMVLLAVFFKTRTGMAIRATGDNEEMVRSSSINADHSRILGIVIANGLVGLSGSLLCQQQKYADLNCGTGMLVVGLASVIIGQVLFGKKGTTIGLVSAICGSLVYRMVIQCAYKVDMPSYFVKLLSTVIVVIALLTPMLKAKLKEEKNRKQRMKIYARNSDVVRKG
ncbi:MAG: ABC transporter permease [Lachnospiraceae bacterium]